MYPIMPQPPAAPLVCEGSPEEMGAAQGAALRAEIRGAYDALREIAAFRNRKPWWMPFALFRQVAARKASRSTAKPVAGLCPTLHARLMGIAKGACIREEALWLMQAMEGALARVDGLVEVPPAGCSAVALRGRASANGRPVIAHNFDYLPAVQPFYAVRESRPQGGYRSLEFTAAPLAGAIDGLNEKGLAVTYNYARTLNERGEPGPTLSMRISELLGQAATVAEAVEAMLAWPRWGSGILMVADAGGDVASVELTSTRSAVRRPEPKAPDFLYHTNKFACAATQAVEVPETAVFGPAGPRPGERVLLSSIRRLERFGVLLNDAAGLTLDDLGRIMADHGDGNPSCDTICMHGDFWVTAASVHCLPAERVLRVSYGSTCAANYVEYSL